MSKDIDDDLRVPRPLAYFYAFLLIITSVIGIGVILEKVIFAK